MPLLAVSSSLGLPDPVVRVADPHWLFVETIHLAVGITGLAMYRSVWIQDTDPQFAVVADLVCRAATVEVIVQETIQDEDMMFGRAEAFFGLLHQSPVPVKNPDPNVRALVELCRSFSGDVVHPIYAALELTRRLELSRTQERR